MLETIKKIVSGIKRIDREMSSGTGFSIETNQKLRDIYIDKIQEWKILLQQKATEAKNV